jgi:hypothetical protein
MDANTQNAVIVNLAAVAVPSPL